jgi:hypothetical protein
LSPRPPSRRRLPRLKVNVWSYYIAQFNPGWGRTALCATALPGDSESGPAALAYFDDVRVALTRARSVAGCPRSTCSAGACAHEIARLWTGCLHCAARFSTSRRRPRAVTVRRFRSLSCRQQ